MSEKKNSQPLVLVSGYYGFGNLGDEAILEELTNELKKLVAPEQIIVLSNDPENTKKAFAVESLNRWKPLNFISLLPRTALLISGGGGLFQDATGIKSSVYYGGQILWAKLLGKKVCIYAQGIGPLRTGAAQALTRLSLSQASYTLVRDQSSQKLLAGWNIESTLTADPVWCLEPTAMPQAAEEQMASLVSQPGLTVGLSLRTAPNFNDQQLQSLFTAMDAALPPETNLLLLPLQNNQDVEPLSKFAALWRQKGRPVQMLNTEAIERPSQWLSILAKLDLLVGMRLHALIMSLKSGVPVVGIAYDPKVSHVLRQFGQPILILTKDDNQAGTLATWLPTLQTAVATRAELSMRARQEAESAKKLACQNFETLARILVHAK